MTDTVLVTYGTTNGSTAEIAEAVADVLRKAGLTVEALPARSVTSVARYDAVVVGGGLYAGRWHKDARRFVRRHRALLAERPVWFFSSGPLDASASERTSRRCAACSGPWPDWKSGSTSRSEGAWRKAPRGAWPR